MLMELFKGVRNDNTNNLHLTFHEYILRKFNSVHVHTHTHKLPPQLKTL